MKIGRWITAFFLSIMVLVISACGNHSDMSAVDPESTEFIFVEVVQGSTLTSAAQVLEENGLIRNHKAFLKYAKKNDLINIKAGKYQFSKAMTGEEMLHSMVEGNVYRGEKISIPEGFQLTQIAQRLDQNGIVSQDEFMKEAFQVEKYRAQYEFLHEIKQENLEGYLYPETYFFEKDSSAQTVMTKMLDAFSDIYEADLKPLLEGNTLNINEAVILGSVIEKESVLEEDRPIISSVFHNRLKINMRLQSDATVQYALEERKSRILYSDLKVDSPYNTYKVYGLPAGAISSPRKSSIIAALQPSESEYLFFLTKDDGSGEQVYSKTFEEHKINKSKYLD